MYNAIKRTGKYHVYHEPFHEVIESLPTEWSAIINRTGEIKDLLRHDFLSGGYFDEYSHLLPEIKKTFTPDISYNLFFLGEHDTSPILKSYIDCLINGSPDKPILQCTRSIGRIQWLKKNFTSKNVFLLRNPWDQWFSYKVDSYISSTPQLIYSQPRLPKVLEDVRTACEYLQLPGKTVPEKLNYCLAHPITPYKDYFLFFAIWLFSLLTAQKECDLIIDMDSISRGEARAQTESSLREIGLEDINFHDCYLHRTIFKDSELSFYQEIEEQVLEIFRQNAQYENWLNLAKEYLNRERRESFVDNLTPASNLESMLEDAARLRTSLRSTALHQAQLVDKSHQTAQALTAQLTTLTAQLTALTAQLTQAQQDVQLLTVRFDGIINSKTWKVGMFFRNIGLFIAPPKSRQAQIIRWLLHLILDPYRKFKSEQRLKENLILVRSSKLFDQTWYLMNNPDVAKTNSDPLRHFIEKGGFEGRDPGPNFSSSWYLNNYSDVKKTGINPLVHYLKYGKQEGHITSPQIVNEKEPIKEISITAKASSNRLAIFTICSKNFTAYARTLFESVSQHHPGDDMFMFLCDEIDSEYSTGELPFNVIPLSALEIPNVQEMAERYNITEFNTAIKPFAFSYLFRKLEKEQIIYLDPDIIVLSPLQEVIDEFDNGSECVLSPHILEPAENVEMSDIKMLQFGIYNLGFLGLRKTPNVLQIVDWWGRQLVEKCVINLAEGLFVDQKWADLFPAFIKRTSILHHPGYNVAYWNLSQRTVELIDGKWYVNRLPLRFAHFSGNKIDDPHFLSRHSGVFTQDNIGDLRYLLKLYRERLYANGHATYSKLPYSFNWNGASGVNLHTPKPKELHLSSPRNVHRDGNSLAAKITSSWKWLRTAAIMSGGWAALVWKALRALKRGGIASIRHRAYLVSNYIEIMPEPTAIKPSHHIPNSIEADWVPKLLVIDSGTPRPDRDAGSVSTYNILKIYIDLGYEVTFIPSDLLYLGEYTEALQALGVRCLHRQEIGSIKDHLAREGNNYGFIVLCRAPVAALYISDIRQYAPGAKIVFDTIDLHYLREAREAELDGSINKIEAAKRAKEWEFNLIRLCDVTIVLSSIENEILKRELELDKVDIRLIPLIFVENVYDIPPFEARKDFLFIGGFPHTPNVDAVIYFCKEILPLIRKNIPDVKFHIIGNSPPPEVLELGNQDGVIVHGYVKDVTQIFRSCKLSVAPLRYGAGIKGKIATSLANGLPVIATTVAAEGMEIEAGKHIMVADDPQQFADLFVRVYKSEDLWTQLSENGRRQAFQVYSAAAGYRRVSKLMQDINPSHKQIDLYTLRSSQEYNLLRSSLSDELNERKALEIKLIKHDQPSFFIKGFCAVCGHESTFNTSFMYSYQTTDDGKMIPNWREHLDCIQCGFTNRIRAAMHIFYQKIRPLDTASLYITEQTTPLFKWLKKRHPNLVGSEYFGNVVPFGTEKDGLRNEDLTALTFPDNSFDYILSFDVMEHVSDDIAALKEVYRCLKPGGTFLFTAPFLQERNEKLVRARLSSDGSIEHILPPEYHGNPVDHEKGALCFRYFAWDLIDDMKRIGFEDPKILSYWSRDFAYLGIEQFMFIGTKGT